VKNLITKSKNILLLGLSAFTMFACELAESLFPNERGMVSEEMIAASSFSFSGFGMVRGNGRVYGVEDCGSSCITSDSATWIVKAERKNFNSNFFVDMEIYNTPEKIIYRFTSNSTIATINGSSINSNTAILEFDFTDGLKACALEERNFTVTRSGQDGDAGNAITFNSSYQLFNLCPPVEVECDNSLSYVENEDGSFSFTFVPKANLDNARLVFTFTEGLVVDGLGDWSINGVTRQKTLDLKAMAIYSWTVFLNADCKGTGQSDANLWTDFTVNGESRKCDLKNIVKSCR